MSAVQASAMTAGMASASAMDGHEGCAGCPQGDDDMQGVVCAAGCVAPALAVLPRLVSVVSINEPVAYAEQQAPVLHGGASYLDPPPPRTICIG